jgi:hexosaminidase
VASLAIASPGGASAAPHKGADLSARLIPPPRVFERRPGRAWISLGSRVEVAGSDSVAVAVDELRLDLAAFPQTVRAPFPHPARVVVRPGAGPAVEHDWQAAESYVLEVGADSVVIRGPSVAGRCYGVQTLRQLLRAAGGGPLPALVVRDYPSVRWRGASDDVSRGQTPTPEELGATISHLAYYKLNIYFLYLEDMMRFRSAPSVGAGRGAFTSAELQELVRAARARNITVVPIFQTVAHQPRLLRAPELARFSEYRPPAPARTWLGTRLWALAPAFAEWAGLPDPDKLTRPLECFALADPATPPRVAELVDEVAAAVPSPFFHLGADEPSDLGRGASAAAVRRDGAGAVYARYLNRLVAHVGDSLGRTPIVYGDVLLADTDALRLLDRRSAVMVWEYDPDSMGHGLARLRRAGFERLFACAGLWNWYALYPNFGRANRNIEAMARAAVSAHAEGIVVASWGDGGARCLRAANWPGYALGAEAAWSGGAPRPGFGVRFASTEYATDPAAAAIALGLVGDQDFDVLAYGQRLFDRRLDVRERGPAFRARMRRLAGDMAEARRAASRAMAGARFQRDGLAALDNAAACLQYAAARELTLDSLARRLQGNPVETMDAADRARWASRFTALRDTVVAARGTYAALWPRHARLPGLDVALSPMDRQARACDALVARLAGANRARQEWGPRASRTN